MGSSKSFFSVIALIFLLFAAALAQTDISSVPRMVRFAGAAPAGTSSVTFAIYDREDAVAPLWLETQLVTADDTGHYTVLLGSTKADGLPASMFASGEARWIGVKVADAPEGARTLLVSVPYALKAGDAETLGGKPLSAFLLADAVTSGSATSSVRPMNGAETGKAPPENDGLGDMGTQNFLAKFAADGTTLVGSALVESGGNLGVGTTTPSFPLELVGSNVSLLQRNPNASSYAGMRIYNDQNSGVRALEIDYSGSTYPSVLVGGGPVGESGVITTTGPHPLALGTNNFARMVFGPTGDINMQTRFILDRPALVVNRFQLFVGDGSNGVTDENYIKSVSTGLHFLNGAGESVTFLNNGNVGIGNTNPQAALDVTGQVHATGGIKFGDATVQTTAATGTLTGITTGANSGLTGGGTSGTLNLSLLTTCNSGNVLAWTGTAWQCTAPAGNGGVTLPFAGSASSASGAFAVTQSNSAVVGDPTFTQAMTTIPAGVIGVSSTTSTTQSGVGLMGFAAGPQSIAIIGWNGATNATGGDGSKSTGILGRSDDPNGVSIQAESDVTSGSPIALSAKIKSPNGIAIQADTNGGTGLAGLFNGAVTVNGGLQVQGPITNASGPLSINSAVNLQSSLTAPTATISNLSVANISPSGAPAVFINGNLTVSGNISGGSITKPGGTFKIDHPLDPTGKFLYHSFVESPDMMNIYNGVITLDAKGQAWITMADWFEALNMEFRYQLTSIGHPAPNLYVAQEMHGNRFKIAGGPAHGKVSWQVTGIRHDAWADAHRIKVEVEKPAAEQGTYLYPDLYLKSGSDKLAADNHK